MANFDLSRLPVSNDPSRVLAHCPAEQSYLPISVLPIPTQGALLDEIHTTERIFVAHQGSGQRWYRTGGVTKALYTAPRMIEIYEKGTTFEQCEWTGDQPGRCVSIEFAAPDLLALTNGDVGSLGLRTQHEVFDHRISRIAFELAGEALGGLPNGRLYVEGLSLALIGILSARFFHDSLTKRAGSVRRLGVHERTRLLVLMREQLGEDLSLTRLAAEVGMSTFHFARVFKETFGATPHRYLLDMRLEAAVEALRRDYHRPIVEIALAHGFGSQSHMTQLMRRRLSLTPRAIRELA
jgi:AraC family transcriptional regulator